MNDNNFFKSKYLIILFIFFSQFLNAEIIIFKDCKNNVYSYDKNDYIIDLNKKMMTREFVYDEKTYQKLRMNRVNKIQKMSQNQARLNHIHNPLLAKIRNNLMKHTNVINRRLREIHEYDAYDDIENELSK